MSDGNLIVNNKLIEKMTSTPFEIWILHQLFLLIRQSPIGIHVSTISVNLRRYSQFTDFKIILKVCFQMYYANES